MPKAIYVFKVSLADNPKIFREIEILGNASLYELAEIITEAFNFYLDHCFGFFDKLGEYSCFDSVNKYELFTDLIEEGEDLEPTDAKSVKKTKISEVWQKRGDKMQFLFDYGDNWRFIVTLKNLGEKENRKEYPRILKKVGSAPKQY